jgi:hypothetical protein
LWGQPIKLAQMASISELLENQRNDIVFFKIIPSTLISAVMYMMSVNFSSIIEKVNCVNYLTMTKTFMLIPVQERGELHNQT